MEQALYHPEHGYYSSGRASIGLKGDYFTNVSVGPLFGQLLAAQFAEIWKRLGQIDNFTIVEQGAHDGEFARDVLTALREKLPEFFSTLRYFIIEPFSVLQDRQSQALKEFGDRVQWRRSLDELEPFIGVHFSNELLDAMPVHLVVSTGEGWREKFVAVDHDQFAFAEQAIVDPALQKRVNFLPAQPAGYETEINLAALDWIDRLSSKVTHGYILIVDYGFPREEFYASDRTRGTLQVRARHRHLVSPLDEIGHADITAHVNWTSVAERAETCGLSVNAFIDQHHFLTGIISEFPALIEGEKAKRALQTLLHPEMLGRAFQVMALNKDIDLVEPLAGFKYARDPRVMLDP